MGYKEPDESLGQMKTCMGYKEPDESLGQMKTASA